MQFEDRSKSKSLPDVLDQALARLKAGESVEACLEQNPQHASALDALLRVGDRLRAEAATPLPAELEDWLAVGARDFAVLTARMAPKYAKQPRGVRAPLGTPEVASPQMQRANILDQALARLRAGQSVDASLAEHAEYAAELQPLMHAGELLQAEAATALPPELQAWLPTGARDFAAIAEQMAPRYARRRARGSRPLTLQRTALAVAIIAAMMGVADTASAHSLPGETLYPWKRAKEDISLALVTNSDQRSHLLVEYAGRRLTEFNGLVDSGDTSDPALVADTLASLLDNLQGAIAEDQKSPVGDVAPMVKQILNDTQSAITRAGPVAPASAPALDQASIRAAVIEQEIPPGTIAASPTGTSTVITPSPATNVPAAGGSTAVPAIVATGSASVSTTAQPTSFADIIIGSPPPTPAPTFSIGSPFLQPVELTPVPANTSTPNPATAIPQTSVPTDIATATAVPADDSTAVPPITTVVAGATGVTTNTATAVPVPPNTNTPVPSATPLPTTNSTSEPPPPTPPPTRTPRNTVTPTPTNTPVPPTDTPTPTDTPVPPTDTPTPTDTPVPPTDTPTDTPTAGVTTGSANGPTETVPTDAPTDTTEIGTP